MGIIKNIIYLAVPVLVAAGCNNGTPKEMLASPEGYNLKVGNSSQIAIRTG